MSLPFTKCIKKHENVAVIAAHLNAEIILHDYLCARVICVCVCVCARVIK